MDLRFNGLLIYYLGAQRVEGKGHEKLKHKNQHMSRWAAPNTKDKREKEWKENEP